MAQLRPQYLYCYLFCEKSYFIYQKSFLYLSYFYTFCTYFLSDYFTYYFLYISVSCLFYTLNKMAASWICFNFIISKPCNGTRTHNHLVCKPTLKHLAKWMSVCLRTKWLWVRVQLQSLKLEISRLFRTRGSLIFKQLQTVDSL